MTNMNVLRLFQSFQEKFEVAGNEQYLTFIYSIYSTRTYTKYDLILL
jgi:hypothetical protein